MSNRAAQLKAPFPAFGGKSRVAGTVWPRLSPTRNPARNYIEPFCFSAAMLLLRPDEPKIETINDLNAYVANFWRAIQADPEAVAAHADWPVNETDLHARHAWLVRSDDAAERLERVRSEPEYFDAKIAGWWCWGACMWIGSGWCEERGVGWAQVPRVSDPGSGVNILDADGQHPQLSQQLPHLQGDAGAVGQKVTSNQAYKSFDADAKRPQLCNGSTTYGQGVHKQAHEVKLNSAAGDAAGHEKRPRLAAFGTARQDGEPGMGVHAPYHRQPAIGQAGWGVNALGDGRPQLADAYSRGRGIHGHDELTDCHKRRLWLIDWFTRLADRLRPVRVCCGHWDRVCDSDSTLTRLGTTAVFLDPPYRKTLADGTENRAGHIYANDKAQDVNGLVDEVQAWCLKWGGDKDIRIAVCGLEGEYPELDAAGWEKLAWKSQGGYGNRNGDNQNAARERIWFNQHCVANAQQELFA